MGAQLDHDGPIASCTITEYGNLPLCHTVVAAARAIIVVGIGLESQFSDSIARTALYAIITVNRGYPTRHPLCCFADGTITEECPTPSLQEKS